MSENSANADEGECCFENDGAGGEGVINILVNDLKECVVTLSFIEFYGDDEDFAGSKNDWTVQLHYQNAKLVEENYERVFVGG